MVIKNIFNVKNYKGLVDGFKVQFDDITYIIGDNAKNKTTIGSLPLWIFTGYNLYGSNKEAVANDTITKSTNTYTSMTIQVAFVKFNGNLYKQSDIEIDYDGGDIPIGKINKLSEKSIPQNDGETNKEYLIDKAIYGTKNILSDRDLKKMMML